MKEEGGALALTPSASARSSSVSSRATLVTTSARSTAPPQAGGGSACMGVGGGGWGGGGVVRGWVRVRVPAPSLPCAPLRSLLLPPHHTPTRRGPPARPLTPTPTHPPTPHASPTHPSPTHTHPTHPHPPEVQTWSVASWAYPATYRPHGEGARRRIGPSHTPVGAASLASTTHRVASTAAITCGWVGGWVWGMGWEGRGDSGWVGGAPPPLIPPHCPLPSLANAGVQSSKPLLPPLTSSEPEGETPGGSTAQQCSAQSGEGQGSGKRVARGSWTDGTHLRARTRANVGGGAG